MIYKISILIISMIISFSCYANIFHLTQLDLYHSAQQYIGMNIKDNCEVLDNLTGENVQTTPWCAGFVNGILKINGVPGTGSLAARSFLHWGHKVKSPKQGDIVIFERNGPNSGQGHVAFFDRFVGNSKIGVLGGGQNHMVKYTAYPLSRVLGYRRI